jgi:hypothetical protein
MWNKEKEKEKSIAYLITMMTAMKTASLMQEDLEYRKNERTTQPRNRTEVSSYPFLELLRQSIVGYA